MAIDADLFHMGFLIIKVFGEINEYFFYSWKQNNSSWSQEL